MKHTRIAGTAAAAAAAAVTLACGTAHAAPVEPGSPDDQIYVDIAPGVAYTSNVSDHSIVLDTPLGTLTTRGTDYEILDSTGALVGGTPLTYQQNPTTWPAATRVDSAFPEPIEPTEAADDLAPVEVLPADPAADFAGALGLAATQFGVAVTVGTVAGSVIGLGVGCLGGAATGGFTALPTGPIAIPAAAFGCLLGAGLGAGIGGVIGAATLGIPVGIASAVQMYNSMHAAGHI